MQPAALPVPSPASPQNAYNSPGPIGTVPLMPQKLRFRLPVGGVVVEALVHAADLDDAEVPVGRDRDRLVVEVGTAHLFVALIGDAALERAVVVEAARRSDVRMALGLRVGTARVPPVPAGDA